MTIRRRAYAEATNVSEAARLIAESNEPLAVSYAFGLLYVLPADVADAVRLGIYAGTDAAAIDEMLNDDLDEAISANG